jgi:tetratricopeptide (TPR) repeat protein
VRLRQSCLRYLAGLLVLNGLLVGCATFDAPVLPTQRLVLDDVPFHPQQDFQCGPAALLSVLEHSDVAASFAELVDQVYVPELRGSLQLELLAAARRYDRLPYVLAPEASELLAWLQQGYPVLILQNLGIRRIPVWHFAVLLGYDGRRDEVLLHSGDRERMAQDWPRFLQSWQRGGRWAAVMLPPGQLPERIDLPEWLELGAAFDEQASAPARLRFWTALHSRWPQSPLVALGLGNAHYANDRLDAAEASFAQGLAQQPDVLALRMNLAAVRLELGRACAAYTVLDAHQPASTHLLFGRLYTALI